MRFLVFFVQLPPSSRFRVKREINLAKEIINYSWGLVIEVGSSSSQ